MAERPILFSGAMVRAILTGRKTQTRRAMRIQPKPFQGGVDVSGGFAYWDGGAQDAACACPYGEPGGRLWVRETWGHSTSGYSWVYAADNLLIPKAAAREDRALYARPADMGERPAKWVPSIHMPRAASRLALEVADVRVERLHDITEPDASAEGVPGDLLHRAKGYAPDAYRLLWEAINGRESWVANPWVWVVTFTRTMEGTRCP